MAQTVLSDDTGSESIPGCWHARVMTMRTKECGGNQNNRDVKKMKNENNNEDKRMNNWKKNAENVLPERNNKRQMSYLTQTLILLHKHSHKHPK